jgi:hypothetical protein
MNDFEDIQTLLIEFTDKVRQMRQNKVGNYSAKLELPAWKEDVRPEFVYEVSANVARFTGHLKLLESSPVISVQDNKTILTEVSKKITDNISFYTKQWGDKHENDFCNKLINGLQDTNSLIAAYSRPDQPRPR